MGTYDQWKTRDDTWPLGDVNVEVFLVDEEEEYEFDMNYELETQSMIDMMMDVASPDDYR